VQCKLSNKNKEIPKIFQITSSKIIKPEKTTPGRPVDSEKTEAFKEIVEFVQSSEGKVVTVNELVSRMEVICGEKAYSTKHMKNRNQPVDFRINLSGSTVCSKHF